jgi:hypothetical protein
MILFFFALNNMISSAIAETATVVVDHLIMKMGLVFEPLPEKGVGDGEEHF